MDSTSDTRLDGPGDGTRLLDRYDAFLIDLDGTLYRGDQAIPGAIETMHQLHVAGRGVAYVTNNSGHTPEEIADRLQGMGLEASPDEVVSSALATAAVLASRGVRSAFCVCGSGLKAALQDRGIEVLDTSASTAEVVVIGWDRTVDYEKLKVAGLLVQRGAALIASNGDVAFPAPDGLWPGAGAILAAVTATTGAQAEIIGKPYPALFKAALSVAGGTRPLVVGDRLDTDIEGAARLGWDTLLVLSGVTSEADLEESGGGVKPTYVAPDISAITQEGLFASGPS